MNLDFRKVYEREFSVIGMADHTSFRKKFVHNLEEMERTPGFLKIDRKYVKKARRDNSGVFKQAPALGYRSLTDMLVWLKNQYPFVVDILNPTKAEILQISTDTVGIEKHVQEDYGDKYALSLVVARNNKYHIFDYEKSEFWYAAQEIFSLERDIIQKIEPFLFSEFVSRFNYILSKWLPEEYAQGVFSSWLEAGKGFEKRGTCTLVMLGLLSMLVAFLSRKEDNFALEDIFFGLETNRDEDVTLLGSSVSQEIAWRVRNFCYLGKLTEFYLRKKAFPSHEMMYLSNGETCQSFVVQSYIDSGTMAEKKAECIVQLISGHMTPARRESGLLGTILRVIYKTQGFYWERYYGEPDRLCRVLNGTTLPGVFTIEGAIRHTFRSIKELLREDEEYWKIFWCMQNPVINPDRLIFKKEGFHEQ